MDKGLATDSLVINSKKKKKSELATGRYEPGAVTHVSLLHKLPSLVLSL
jgi:hypothetical protein